MDGLNTKTLDKPAAQPLEPVFGNSPNRCGIQRCWETRPGRDLEPKFEFRIGFWFKTDFIEFVLLDKIYGRCF